MQNGMYFDFFEISRVKKVLKLGTTIGFALSPDLGGEMLNIHKIEMNYDGKKIS
jgi:hypothetical protein